MIKITRKDFETRGFREPDGKGGWEAEPSRVTHNSVYEYQLIMPLTKEEILIGESDVFDRTKDEEVKKAFNELLDWLIKVAGAILNVPYEEAWELLKYYDEGDSIVHVEDTGTINFPTSIDYFVQEEPFHVDQQRD